MTDAYGNLTVDAMFLYNKEMLSANDKALMDAVLQQDEMARDALEGYALLDNAKDAKVAIGAINNSLGAEKAATPAPVVKLDYRRLSAAAAVIILIGIGAFVGTRFISQDKLAENTIEKAEEVESQKNKKDASPAKQNQGLSKENSNSIEAEEGADIEFEKSLDIPEEPAGIQIGSNEQPDEEVPVAANSSTFDLNNSRDQDNADKEENREALLERLAALQEQKAEVSKPVQVQVDEVSAKRSESQSVAFMTEDKATDLANEPVADDMMEAEEIAAVSELDQRVNLDTKAIEAKDEIEENSRVRKAKMARESDAAPAPTSYNAGADSDAAPMIYAADQVDQTPRFPGGDLELFRFIEKRKVHPANLKAQGVEGEVFVSFEIDANGAVSNVKPLRSDNSQMEADAIRVVRSMPKWQAAKKGGYPVSVKKTILIKYMLDNE